MADDQYRCTLPFSHLHVTSRGVMTPCCNFEWRTDPLWNKMLNVMRENSENDTMDSLDPQLPWIKHGVTNVLNSKVWYDLRKKSKSNQYESGCSNCYFSEKSTGRSRRTWANSEFPDADNDVKIVSMELKLGAKCNLACRTCGYTSSNKLLKENSYEMFGNVNTNWMKRLQKLSDWVHDENVWNELKELSHDLEYIQFTGGEPLLIQEHYDYLKHLIDNNINPKLQYITNATIGVDAEKKKLWDNIDDITFDFSIDGVGKLGEYMRTGSVWEEQVANIQSFIDYKKEREERGLYTSLSFATTVSILNVVGVKEVVDFIHDRDLQDSGWTINIVRHPQYLDMANLTGAAKEYAIEKTLQITNSNRYEKKFRDEAQVIIDRLNTEYEPLDYTKGILRKDKFYNLANSDTINYIELMPEWWNKLVDN